MSNAIIMLLQITAVLLVATVAHLFIRSAAARHAVLLCALVVVGICPALFFAARQFAPVAKISWMTLPVEVAPHVVEGLRAGAPTRTNHSNLPEILAGSWAIGTVIALLRLGIGLRKVHRIRSNAILCEAHDVLVSDDLSIPLAVGIFKPVVIIPKRLLAELNEEQLLQVLAHERAHAMRHDPLVGLYQRLLAAALWFHPLVHWVNRRLDLAREELCDAHVVSGAAATEYAQTLLTIAQSLTAHRPLVVPTLLNSTSQLEKRIQRLLSQRSTIMTRINRWQVAIIAMLFIAAGFAVGCARDAHAGDAKNPTTAPTDLPHVVKFEKGAKKFTEKGDDIEITEVRGTSAKIEAGHIYLVKGTYKLASHDKASLAAYTTVKKSEDDGGRELRVQTAQVTKGEGTFTLYLPMTCDGWPHVSFYPAGGGSDIGGAYFGTGETTLRKWWGEK